MQDDQPDPQHVRPAQATTEDVAAAGKMSEALEWVERARGQLYNFHQMMGHADFMFGDAAKLLEKSRKPELAKHVENEIVGRNVLSGRWTFQIIEEFNALYYKVVAAAEQEVREQLMDGRKHVFESELKEQRRTHGKQGHRSRPAEDIEQ